MQYTQQQRLAPEVPDESALYSPIETGAPVLAGTDSNIGRNVVRAVTGIRSDHK